jgi:hypothetical protein
MEVCFLTPLQVEAVDDTYWRVLTGFQISIETRNRMGYLTVPAGFTTDFASVPRVPFAYWLFGNVTHKPAVIHDYLYTIGGTQRQREYADNVFFHAMLADKESRIKASAMFRAVRLFGRSHWKSKVRS